MEAGVELLTADKITQDEESDDLGHAVAVDHLPHSFAGALLEEGEHGGIVVGVAQPRGEVLLGDAPGFGRAPPLAIERTGEVDAAELGQGVEADGQHDERYGENEQATVGADAAARGQQDEKQTADGIEQQDVAAPDEQQMEQTDGGQNEHAAHKEPTAAAHQDEGKADAEEDGEDRIELAVDEGELQIAHDAVDRGRRHGGLGVGQEECPKGKLGVVGQGNAHGGQSADDIKDEVSLAFGCRSVVGHGDDKSRFDGWMMMPVKMRPDEVPSRRAEK